MEKASPQNPLVKRLSAMDVKIQFFDYRGLHSLLHAGYLLWTNQGLVWTEWKEICNYLCIDVCVNNINLIKCTI